MSMNISSIKLSNSALAPVAYARFAEAIMTDLMFEVPSQGKKNITITKAYAEEKMNRVNAQKLRA